MDPGGTYEEDNALKIDGCTTENQYIFRTPENELSCPSYFRFLRRVNARSVRFKNTNFTENEARAGGAIFTNTFTIISILQDLHGDLNPDVDNSLGYALTKNASLLKNTSVIFKKNVAVNGGYGDDAASTPVKALLVNLDDREYQRTEGFTNSSFLSGDRLRFNVDFNDGMEQRVTFPYNLTAYISCDENRSRKEQSDCAYLEISGQETAQANKDRTINFTAVRLRGLRDQTYILRIDYHSTSELQTLDVTPSFVTVTMRSCELSERTVSHEGEYLECHKCSSFEYNLDPEGDVCKACPENANCEPRLIIPDDGYWHASPCSERIQGCLTSHACAFEGRSMNLRHTTHDMTSCDFDMAKIDEYQEAQCTEVGIFQVI